MNSKDLVRDEFYLLETALARFGAIVTIDQFASLYRGKRNYLRRRLSTICEKGWLYRIRRGLYIISDLATRGTLAISQYAVVSLLSEEAYVSFENALHYHNLFDQLQNQIISIATQQRASSQIAGFTYHFIKAKQEFFYGWESHIIDNIDVKIATREKALIDLIQFHRNRYAVDLVLEKLTDLRGELDIKIFTNLILRSNVATQRVMGFLFDLARIDSNILQDELKHKHGTSRITASNKNLYSSKWNLYYDDYFTKYA